MAGAAVVPPESIADLLADEGDFVVVGTSAYYLIQYDSLDADADPLNPDHWPAPYKVTSDRFRRFLSKRWKKLVPGTKRWKDVQAACTDRAYGSGRTLREVQFSVYDDATNTLRLALSPSLVVRVSPGQVHPERNGEHALFRLPHGFQPLRWSQIATAWNPTTATQLPAFGRAVADNLPPPNPRDGAERAEHSALLRAWWLGVFASTALQGRPILALFGQPQSGKSATARLMGKLFFGAAFEVSTSVSGSRVVKDLVATVNAMPLAIRDDVNRAPPEIVDTLCSIATGASVTLARMHETLALDVFRTDASVCITAHTPQWATRADLLSRMVMLRFVPAASSPLSLEDRHRRAIALRPAVWAEVLATLAVVIGRHDLRWETLTRFEGWETLVRRAAHFGEWHEVLHMGLWRMTRVRVALAADCDPFLGALAAIGAEQGDNPRYYTASELYDLVVSRMGGATTVMEADRASTRALSSVRALGRFLAQLANDAPSVVSIHRGPYRNGVTTWMVRPLA